MVALGSHTGRYVWKWATLADEFTGGRAHVVSHAHERAGPSV